MTAGPRISVMICTKDRPTDVKELLDCLARQTLPPNQIVVVDASTQDGLAALLAAQVYPFETQYYRAVPGVMRQRNIGISHCDGGFIFCLDDDLLPDPAFVEEMLKPLQQNPNIPISAVIGRIVDEGKWAANVSWRGRLYYMFRNFVVNVFLLDKPGSGRFRYSTLATYPRDDVSGRLIECVAGGCVVYRRAVFDNFIFDENFFYPPLDDLDTSKRLMALGHNVYYQPSAQVLHKKSPGGRTSRTNFYRIWVTHYYYIFTKNWPQTLPRKLAFWWAVLGQLVLTATYPDQVQGVLAGISNIRETKSPVDAMQRLIPVR
jgi:GT2 family glycosyltransferase